MMTAHSNSDAADGFLPSSSAKLGRTVSNPVLPPEPSGRFSFRLRARPTPDRVSANGRRGGVMRISVGVAASFQPGENDHGGGPSFRVAHVFELGHEVAQPTANDNGHNVFPSIAGFGCAFSG